MHLDQAAQAPLVLTVGNEKLSVPLFTLDEFIALGRMVDGERADAITRGHKPFERAQLLAFFSPPPTTIDDLRQHVRTPYGAHHIAAKCLSRAQVIERDGLSLASPEPLPRGRAEQLVAAATKSSLVALAVALADADDRQNQPQDDEAKGDGNDPLPGGSSTGST